MQRCDFPTRRPLEQDGLGVAHPGAGGQRVDVRALDRRLEGEVEVLERLAERQVGDLERGLHPPLLAAGELGGQQLVEEGVRRDLGTDRLAEQLPEPLGGIAAAEREQPLARGVDVEPGLRRAHRATSARSA
jgi:hypothetical protein